VNAGFDSLFSNTVHLAILDLAVSSASPMTSTSERANVGVRVRNLRAEAGMSLRALASSAGLSPSFISQVENGQVSPSIASLERIAIALGATLGAMFAGDPIEAARVVRAGQRRRLSSSWSCSKIEALSPVRTGNCFEAVMITVAPGGRSGTLPTTHSGEEFALCFGGKATLTLDDHNQVLGRGDAVSYASETPHLWENRGRKDTQIVIVSPRFTH
jgi:transcriptional regulator with XRE-family HTH domain